MEGVAEKTGISKRGAQALLDGLTGLGVVTIFEGRYQNTAEASTFLVQGKPAYLGGMAEVTFAGLEEWIKLPDAAKSGKPTAAEAEVPDNEFWQALVPAITALSFPVAQMAAETHPVAMEFVGIDNTYAESGTPDQLLDKYGLRAANIVSAARKAIERKR